MALAFDPAREEDASVIASLRQRCWAATYRGVYPDEMIDHFDHAWHAQRDLARIRDPRCAVRVIRDSGLPIGYITLRRGEQPLLQSLYVLPDHQRRGVGRAAFAHIRSLLGAEGCAAFTCHCLPGNAPARAFYERMGGLLCGEDTGNDEAWQDSVIYRFPVRPDPDPLQEAP